MIMEKLGAKNLKSSGCIMIEKYDNSIKNKKSKKIAGGLGRTAAPPIMIKKIIIQLGPIEYLLKQKTVRSHQFLCGKAS